MSPWFPIAEGFSGGWPAVLWHVSWEAGLLIVAVWITVHVLPRIPARVRCWLWRLVFAKLVLGLIWVTPLNLPILSSRKLSYDSYHADAKGSDTAPPQPPGEAGASGMKSPINARNSAGLVSPSEPGNAKAGFAKPTRGSGAWLFLAWLTGVLICLVRWATCVTKVRRWRAAARGKGDAPEHAVLRKLSLEMGLRRVSGLVWLAEVGSPVLVGIRKPLILLPERLHKSFNASELELVLSHELAHVRRRDLLWNLLLLTGHALFFFHPLVWLARREWLLAQELACDEVVLASQTGRIAEYGAALMKVIEGRFTPSMNSHSAAAGVAASGQNLKRRFAAMKQIRKTSSARLAIWLGALIMSAIFTLVPWKLVAQAPREKSPSKRLGRGTPSEASAKAKRQTTLTGTNDALKAELATLADQHFQAATSNSPTQGSTPRDSIQSPIRQWLARVNQLQQRLKETPNARIPELNYLTALDWLEVAAHASLKTDADYRRTLAELRTRAEKKIVPKLQLALCRYMQAHDLAHPHQLSQLKPYFAQPVPNAILHRWKIVAQARKPQQGGDDGWCILPKGPVDPDYDLQITIDGPFSSGSRPYPTPPTAEELELKAILQGIAKPKWDLHWLADFSRAKKEAQKKNRLILMDFTGSDWCGWCAKFDKDILWTKEFHDYASKHLVLVRVDFPHKKFQSAKTKKTNQALKKEYRVKGYPTFIFLGKEGKELGRQVGYAAGGARRFISMLEQFRKAR